MIGLQSRDRQGAGGSAAGGVQECGEPSPGRGDRNHCRDRASVAPPGLQSPIAHNRGRRASRLPPATCSGPYDCAMLLVHVKEYKMTWNLEVAIWKEPVGRLEDCDLHGAPNAPNLHSQTEGADDQQH